MLPLGLDLPPQSLFHAPAGAPATQPQRIEDGFANREIDLDLTPCGGTHHPDDDELFMGILRVSLPRIQQVVKRNLLI